MSHEEKPTVDPPKPLWRRGLRVTRDLIIAALVLMIALLVVGWLRAPDLPDKAPQFTLATPDGSQVSLSDYRGKTVLLNFWATWCPPCRLEIPAFSRFAARNPDVVVLGLASDNDPKLVARAAEELGADYTVLLADPKTLEAYGVTTFPTTVVVGPDGDVRSAYTGIMLDPQLAWATLGL